MCTSVLKWLLLVCLISGFSLGCGSGEKKAVPLSEQISKALQLTDPGQKARELAKLAAKQKENLDDLGCASTLNSAADAAKSIEDPISRGSVQTVLGIACGKMDMKPEAKKYLSAAGTSIESATDSITKVTALCDRASATAEWLKNPDLAAEQLSKAEAEVNSIKAPADKVTAWGKIFVGQDKIGKSAETDRLSQAVDTFCQALEAPRDKAECLAQWGLTLSQAKRTDVSQSIFDEALKAADEITDPESQAYARLHLGQKLAKADRADAAKKQLTQAEKIAGKITDGSVKGPILEDVNQALSKLAK